MSNEGAVKSYDTPRRHGGAPRETEGRALLESARRLAVARDDPQDKSGLRDAVRLNWRLWTIFQAELSAPDCPFPVEIRSNMLNLCNFVDKRTVAILAKPAPQMLDVLINVNRQIAAGLLTKADQGPADRQDETAGDAAQPAKPGGFSI